MSSLPRYSLLDHALERFKFALRFRRPYAPPHKNGAPNYLGWGGFASYIVTGPWLKVFRCVGIRVSCGLSFWAIVFRDIKDECKNIIIYQHGFVLYNNLHRWLLYYLSIPGNMMFLSVSRSTMFWWVSGNICINASLTPNIWRRLFDPSVVIACPIFVDSWKYWKTF